MIDRVLDDPACRKSAKSARCRCRRRNRTQRRRSSSQDPGAMERSKSVTQRLGQAVKRLVSSKSWSSKVSADAAKEQQGAAPGEDAAVRSATRRSLSTTDLPCSSLLGRLPAGATPFAQRGPGDRFPASAWAASRPTPLHHGKLLHQCAAHGWRVAVLLLLPPSGDDQYVRPEAHLTPILAAALGCGGGQAEQQVRCAIAGGGLNPTAQARTTHLEQPRQSVHAGALPGIAAGELRAPEAGTGGGHPVGGSARRGPVAGARPVWRRRAPVGVHAARRGEEHACGRNTGVTHAW